MNERLVRHIKKKLHEKDEILDHFDEPSDDEVRQLMLMTFHVVHEKCLGCFYCKNYKRFSMSSLCRIKSHTQKNCYHFTLDPAKVLKKKYHYITMKLSEYNWAKRRPIEEIVSAKTQKNIIYESVRLYELLQVKDALELI